MPPRTRSSSGQPEFMTNETAGDLLAAFIADAADQYEKDASERGQSALAASTVRMARRASVQIREVHGLDDEPELVPSALGTLHDGNTYGGEA